MTNTVLIDAKVKEVTSPLLACLLNKDLLQPVHNKQGVVTDDFGY